MTTTPPPSRRASLRPLFDELNRMFWDGRLAAYRVRRKDMHLRSHGLCNRKTRTIYVNAALDAATLRKALLHEMCHIAGDNHGKRFLRELARLEARGETWAKAEQALYGDRSNAIQTTAGEVRSFIADALLDLPEAQWSALKLYTAHEFGLTLPEFDRKFPWARTVFAREQRRAQQEQEQAARWRATHAEEATP